jgi:hypothetical protein
MTNFFREIKKGIQQEVEKQISSSKEDFKKEIELFNKEKIDSYIATLIQESIIPNLESELKLSETMMDIGDPFVQKKILQLNNIIEKLKHINVATSWGLEINKDLAADIIFMGELDLIFKQIDSGTKYIPKINFFSKIEEFLKSLLGG